MAHELWVPADAVTVTQTTYTNGESGITMQGTFRRHTPTPQLGFEARAVRGEAGWGVQIEPPETTRFDSDHV